MFAYELNPCDISADLRYIRTLIKHLNQKTFYQQALKPNADVKNTLDFILIPCNPRNKASVDALCAATILQKCAKDDLSRLCFVPTFSAQDSRAHSQLLGAKYAGFQMVALIGGDNVDKAHYIDTIAFITLAREILGEKAKLISGSASDLSCVQHIARLNNKIKAGVDIIITQPIFSLNVALAFLRDFNNIVAKANVKRPICAMINIFGVFSTSSAQAINAANLGFEVPREYMRMMENAPTKAFQMLLNELSYNVSHLYLSTSKPNDRRVFDAIC